MRCFHQVVNVVMVSKKLSKPRLSSALAGRERKLNALLEGYGQVMVAYSGGVDSTLLLHEAASALGPGNVVAVTARSELFFLEEQQRAKELCKRFGVQHHMLDTTPLKDAAIKRNDPERCYHCKRRLLEVCASLAAKLKIQTLIEASQVDDLGDYRPGARAVAEFGVKSPLKEAGLNKADVRALSRHHRLPTAELPAAACLASRVPYGTELDRKLLGRIARAEAAIRKLGFRQFRLRHHGDVARLEFEKEELEKAFRYRRSLADRVCAQGWTYVALDLTGYRQGSLNKVIGHRSGSGKKKP
jgi:uncharacterized protein